MAEDWRLHIDLHEEGIAHELGERLAARELEHELDDSFGGRLVVSRNGAEVFVYSDSPDQAERAQQLIISLSTKHEWQLDAQLERWHEDAEVWEAPDAPLPQERAESAQRGYVEWEVRVDCTSHHEAVKLAETLSAEGLSNIRRWRYVLVGAADEDSARALAERIRGLVPADATVAAELSGRAALDEMPHSPFAIF